MLKGFVSGEEKDIKRIPMKGKNLFDKSNTTIYNAYITDTQGIWRLADDSRSVKIPCLPNTNYTLSIPQSVSIFRIYETSDSSALPSDQTVLNRLVRSQDLSQSTFTTGANAAAIIFQGSSGAVETWFNGLMLNLGSQPLPYEPYGYQEGWEVRDNQDRLIWGREDELQTTTGTLPFKGYGLPVKVKSLLGNAVQNGTPAPDNIITPEMCGVRTGNLFDKNSDDITNQSKFLADGTMVYNQYFCVTGFIRIKPNTYYSQGPGNNGISAFNAFYDEDKNFISSFSSTGDAPHTAKSPANAVYIRLSLLDTSTQGFQVAMLVEGTSLPENYVPYGWQIPLTNAGQTLPVYLGEVPTVRRIKKVVFTGQETWTEVYPGEPEAQGIVMYATSLSEIGTDRNDFRCSHFFVGNYRGYLVSGQGRINGESTSAVPEAFNVNYNNGSGGLQNFKAWLASEYAAGHPVTLWYALATEQISVVNEPLCKISTYADELTTIQVHGLSAPLYGIGDYKDTLNLSTGVVTRKVKKLVLTGNESWLFSTYPYLDNFLAYGQNYLRQKTNICVCTHLQTSANVQSGESIVPDTCCFMTEATGGVFYYKDTSVSDLASFKSWLQQQYANGTPVCLWYVLETPTTETVTVPTGMTGEIEGYLTQVSTPSPTNRSVPKWNGVEESGGTYAVTVYTPPEIPTTTGQNTLTVDTDLAPSKLEVSIHAKKIHYGFKIDKSNDDSDSAVIYTYDAVTMTPAHMDFTNDRFDYGSWGNAFFVRDCYPVALNLDGTIAYRLDPDDYTKKTDGTSSDIFYELLTAAPSDWSTQWKQYYTKDANDNYELNSQGSAPTFTTDTYYKLTYNSSFTGNFMMAFPKVWFYRHEDSQYNYIEISNQKLSDDWKCYAHINASGQEVDFIYLPLFKGVIVNSKLRSIPGVIPSGGTTAPAEAAAASACGSRWQMWDHSSVNLINDLMTLMSKSIDAQGKFGKGRESGYNSSDTVTYGKLQTGTLVKGGKFKGFSSSYKEVKVFGIEGFWANRWDRIQGMLLDYNVWKIKMTPPYNFTGTNFVTLSNASVPSGTGYLSRVQTSQYGSIPASIEGGAEDKFYRDGFYKNANRTCVAMRAGNCDCVGLAGPHFVYVEIAGDFTAWSIGASPVYK